MSWCPRLWGAASGRATSSRNGGRHHVGTAGRLRRNPQEGHLRPFLGKRFYFFAFFVEDLGLKVLQDPDIFCSAVNRLQSPVKPPLMLRPRSTAPALDAARTRIAITTRLFIFSSFRFRASTHASVPPMTARELALLIFDGAPRTRGTHRAANTSLRFAQLQRVIRQAGT
jgi:hypothetical protein